MSKKLENKQLKKAKGGANRKPIVPVIDAPIPDVTHVVTAPIKRKKKVIQ